MNTLATATAAALVCLALAGGQALAQQGPGPKGPQAGMGSMMPGGPGMMQGQGMMGGTMHGGPGMMGGQGMMGHMMHGDGSGMMPMGPGKHVEGRLAFLRAEIGITEAQAKVWNAFADAVRQSGKGMTASMPMMQPKDAKTDWLAHLEQHEKMLAAHLEGLRAIRAAAQPLYAALSDEQKRIADDLMAGPMGPMGGMGRMMRM